MGMDVTEHGAPAYPELVPRDSADPRRDMLVPGTMGQVEPAMRTVTR
jgi:hypothetical protein